MFQIILLIIFCTLAFGMLTNPLATLPFAVLAATVVSGYLLIRFIWPKKEKKTPESHALMDLIALLSPWH